MAEGTQTANGTEPAAPLPSVTAPEGWLSPEQVAAQTAALVAKNAQLLREKKIAEGKAGTEVDLDEYKSLKEEKAKRAEQEAIAKGEFEKLRQHQAQEHAKALDAERATSKKAASALNNLVLQVAAMRALSNPKSKAVNPELLLPHVQAAVEIVEDNGEFVPRIKDKTGGYRFGAKGEYMTVDEYVATDLVERYPSAFEGHQASGSGATGAGGAGTGGQKTMSRSAFDELQRTDPGAAKTFMKGGGTLKDG